MTAIAGLGAAGARGAELTLSDFNGTGFTYTFDDWQQITGPASVRLVDLNNGWGGAGLVGDLNLSAYGDGRFVVDVSANIANEVGLFVVELIDSQANTGKWTFSTSGLASGSTTTLVSTTTLNEPTDGLNQWWNLDLSRIERWQILGDFGSPSPVDLSFDRVAVSTTVAEPPAYPGAEPDAAWRAEAEAAIEQHRKSDLSVVVAGSGGVVSGVGVRVDMTEHAFRWGTAVQARRLDDNLPSNAVYKQVLEENFNTATLENALKWPPFEGEWGPDFGPAASSAALDWLNDRDFDVRGHVQVWPGYDNLPSGVKSLVDEFNQAGTSGVRREQIRGELRTLVSEHITALSSATAGKITWWDMVNETRTNRDLIEILGESEVAAWFVEGAAANPGIPLYLNDFGILSSGGGTNTSNQQIYADQVQRILDDGGPLGGIGLQSHFTEGSLTGPEGIKTILDRYAAFGLPLHITEFDFTTTDEALQAQYTRDFMTVIFAHPDVEAFIQWGFWEGGHWRPDAAMYRQDWSIKPNGEAYQELVFDAWWTDESATTDSGGLATVRAFHGEHDVRLTHEGITQVHRGVLVPEGGAGLLVFLADGHVGALDADVINEAGRLRVAGDGVTGSLLLNGVYTQLAGGTLVMEVGEGGVKDLVIADRLELDGVLEVLTSVGYWPAAGTEISLLSASSLSGRFAEVLGDRLLLEGFAQGSVVGVRVLGLIGDFDMDGALTAADIDLLAGGLGDVGLDVTGDGQSDAADVEHLVSYLLGTAFGDANLDRRIDLVDLSTLASGFGQAGGWSAGDFNGDGLVDLIDLSVLASGFGYTADVPEPSGLGLMLVGLSACRRRVRRA